MKVIAYCRVSTAEQEQRDTISMQYDQLRRWAEAGEHEVIETYQDEDASGTLMLEERPGGSRLLADLQRHQANGVTHLVVYEWSRLARDPMVFWGAVFKVHRQAGLDILSLTERETLADPDGVLLLCIRNGINYTERIRTVRRSIDATEMLVREGAWVGGAPPYGYRIQGQRREARIVPSEEKIPGLELSEVDVVRRIFRWCVDEHASTQVIADRLNSLGIPPALSRPGRTKKRAVSGKWTNNTIGKLIGSSTYRGVHIWGARQPAKSLRKGGPIERECPALVDAATWERAQEVIRENALWADRNVKREYLLRGLIRCGACGRNYVGSAIRVGERWHRFYKCAGSPRERQGCQNRTVPATLEERVWATILRFAENPGAVLEEWKEERQEAADAPTTELDLVRGQLGKVARQRNRILELLRQETIDFQTGSEQLAQLRAEGQRYQTEEVRLTLEQAKRERQGAGQAAASALLKELRGKLTSETEFSLKRTVIEAVVSRILVTPDRECDCADIKISYEFPARAGPISRDISPMGCPSGEQPQVIRRHRHCGRGRGVRWEDDTT